MKSINLIMKATRRCNLRCAYCGDWRVGRDNTMSFALVAKTIHRALDEYDCVQFTWHGGETTVLPISFYKKAMLVQARFRRNDQVVVNSLQTNGTLIDDEWACFLRDARFHVGVSIDGPREVQDRMRPYASGKGSFDDVLRGIRALRRRGVAHGVILVADRGVLELGPERIFNFFVEIGVSSFSCIPVKPVDQPEVDSMALHYTSSHRMRTFLCGLYDKWLDHGDPNIHITELDAIRNRLRGQEPGSCTVGGTCFGKYFTIEPNGDVKHCDCFQEASSLGNVFTSSFADVVSSDAVQTRIRNNERELRVLQDSCSHFEVTRGGCPHDRSLAAEHGSNPPETCCSFSGLIEHVRERMHLEARMAGQPMAATA